MHALGCIFAIIFGLFWLIAASIINIYNIAFGSPKRKEKKQWSYNATRQSAQEGNAHSKANSRQRRRKMFEDNEGEYVDFVEVKE